VHGLGTSPQNRNVEFRCGFCFFRRLLLLMTNCLCINCGFSDMSEVLFRCVTRMIDVKGEERRGEERRKENRMRV
jgi:hypothetical protein